MELIRFAIFVVQHNDVSLLNLDSRHTEVDTVIWHGTNSFSAQNAGVRRSIAGRQHIQRTTNPSGGLIEPGRPVWHPAPNFGSAMVFEYRAPLKTDRNLNLELGGSDGSDGFDEPIGLGGLGVSSPSKNKKLPLILLQT